MLCAGSADAALRQKDRKATTFYARRESNITVPAGHLNAGYRPLDCDYHAYSVNCGQQPGFWEEV